MDRILINGNFLCRNLTGIERFAFETCRELDGILTENDDVAILVPKNAKKVPEYRNIRKIMSDVEIHGFPYWDMFVFASACRKNGAVGLSFSNTAPLLNSCGYAFIHDVYAKDYPGDFKGFKDNLIKLYCRFSYRNIAKHAKKVFTVSEFSRGRIQHYYHTEDSRIAVIPNGWEHFRNVDEDDSIMQKHPELKDGDFFFTLGSLSKRKNLVWIAEHAEKNPENTYAISGKAISGLVPSELEILQKLKNVVLLGYVSDAEVKSLMKHCRAFILPSYYEGFGIPPLETLSVGSAIIVSSCGSLPEIYGKTAHYIDYDNADADLDAILREPVENPESVLEKYTYKNAASLLLKELRP